MPAIHAGRRRLWAAALVKKRTADLSKDDPHARCLPSNIPRGYTLPHYQKVIQVPGLLLMINEFNASYRQICLENEKSVQRMQGK